MNEKDKIVLVYTGDEVTVARIRVNLELKEIVPIVKDGLHSGMSAGFAGGTRSTIELYVIESDFEKATEIINALKV